MDTSASAGDMFGVWLAIAVIVAVLVGTAAGVLMWLDCRRITRAVLMGGAAFAGTITLFALIITAARTVG